MGERLRGRQESLKDTDRDELVALDVTGEDGVLVAILHLALLLHQLAIGGQRDRALQTYKLNTV